MDPAALAREYVLLGLRCDRLVPGFVDSHTGEHALRRQVANEALPAPTALVAQARWIRAELSRAGLSARRLHFLDRQLAAVECSMRRAAGASLGFRAEVRAYFDTEIELGDPDRYRAVHAELGAMLPGGRPLAERLATFRTAHEVPPSRLGPCVQALSQALRALTRERIGLPPEETVYYEVVHDQPWSAFNGYLGGYRSRVAVNADAAHRVSRLPQLVAHESYPGHHTERCRTESGLLAGHRHPEQAIFLVNTPQCLLSEGLADLGLAVLVGPGWARWAADVLSDLAPGMDAELAERVERALDLLLAVRQDAALMLHDRGASEDEATAHLRRWLLISEPRARQMLRFLTHPLWRAYTTAYVEGHRLLRAWLDARPAGEPPLVRFLRVLDEPLTPSAIRAELPPIAR